MRLESIAIENFRCFGPSWTQVDLDRGVTAFVGGNGSGKTTVFLALARLFGTSPAQRSVRCRDFHIPPNAPELVSGATLSIEALFGFPELDEATDQGDEDSVPEFFSQMAASAPGAPLKARMRLQATWTGDGTPDGSVDEDLRWITTLDDQYEWEECKRVLPSERGAVQLVYVPVARDASDQVTALLKGRLWQAARWSEGFRDVSTESAGEIQRHFEGEQPARFVVQRLARRWRQVHEADTDTTPSLRLVDRRFEELVRKAEFAFSPDEAGQERALADLSDGQRSLFHIALTAATLEVEKDAFAKDPDEGFFDREKLRRVHLTLLAVEEPENSLSPFFLSRIISLARDIAALPTAQVALSSHSPAILSRIDPEEVRYCRLDRPTRQSSIRELTLPQDDAEISQYVRLAVKAYPELYFARFVILAEGDSEQLVIPRLSEAMDVPLDPSFVPIVPLGGRYVMHFWRLLNDLQIPHATLLDFDLGRVHGGARLIESVVINLRGIQKDFTGNSYVQRRLIDPARVGELNDGAVAQGYDDNVWLQALREEGVFLSYPIDLDFSMLSWFGTAYMVPHPGGRGPRDGAEALKEKKGVTLKTNGKPELYKDNSWNEPFRWYPYLFLNRSKPETHLAALSRIPSKELIERAPPELKALVEHVRAALALADAGA